MAGYVAKIDAKQKSMFQNPSGTKIAWTSQVISKTDADGRAEIFAAMVSLK